ncbi:hypothetical protein SAMN04488012_101118 [Palleronia salina]|uniref:Uncharacterized protein n=1 Tax=Palleronia salina TaxID=313368 RepID=A0A1M6AGM2_9RHOB|nr:hypothetical protein [Palleronia salina]SHI35615.1 hypothetical protein SAMN04488012_101118 [Palleronia salina]
MLIVFESIDAETMAVLRAPMRAPGGVAFQPVDMQTALDGVGAFRLTASLILTPEADSTEAADWLWERVEEAAPLVLKVGAQRARVGAPDALAWLIDKARSEG